MRQGPDLAEQVFRVVQFGHEVDLAVLCGGEVVVEDDAIPGLDLERLRAQAWDAVRGLMSEAA